MICYNGEPSDCDTVYDPSPADCSTLLIEEDYGKDYDKIPLILIHGIHGNVTEKDEIKEDNICNPS